MAIMRRSDEAKFEKSLSAIIAYEQVGRVKVARMERALTWIEVASTVVLIASMVLPSYIEGIDYLFWVGLGSGLLFAVPVYYIQKSITTQKGMYAYHCRFYAERKNRIEPYFSHGDLPAVDEHLLSESRYGDLREAMHLNPATLDNPLGLANPGAQLRQYRVDRHFRRSGESWNMVAALVDQQNIALLSGDLEKVGQLQKEINKQCGLKERRENPHMLTQAFVTSYFQEAEVLAFDEARFNALRQGGKEQLFQSYRAILATYKRDHNFQNYVVSLGALEPRVTQAENTLHITPYGHSGLIYLPLSEIEILGLDRARIEALESPRLVVYPRESETLRACRGVMEAYHLHHHHFPTYVQQMCALAPKVMAMEQRLQIEAPLPYEALRRVFMEKVDKLDEKMVMEDLKASFEAHFNQRNIRALLNDLMAMTERESALGKKNEIFALQKESEAFVEIIGLRPGAKAVRDRVLALLQDVPFFNKAQLNALTPEEQQAQLQRLTRLWAELHKIEASLRIDEETDKYFDEMIDRFELVLGAKNETRSRIDLREEKQAITGITYLKWTRRIACSLVQKAALLLQIKQLSIRLEGKFQEIALQYSRTLRAKVQAMELFFDKIIKSRDTLREAHSRCLAALRGSGAPDFSDLPLSENMAARCHLFSLCYQRIAALRSEADLQKNHERMWKITNELETYLSRYAPRQEFVDEAKAIVENQALSEEQMIVQLDALTERMNAFVAGLETMTLSEKFKAFKEGGAPLVPYAFETNGRADARRKLDVQLNLHARELQLSDNGDDLMRLTSLVVAFERHCSQSEEFSSRFSPVERQQLIQWVEFLRGLNNQVFEHIRLSVAVRPSFPRDDEDVQAWRRGVLDESDFLYARLDESQRNIPNQLFVNSMREFARLVIAIESTLTLSMTARESEQVEGALPQIVAIKNAFEALIQSKHLSLEMPSSHRAAGSKEVGFSREIAERTTTLAQQQLRNADNLFRKQLDIDFAVNIAEVLAPLAVIVTGIFWCVAGGSVWFAVASLLMIDGVRKLKAFVEKKKEKIYREAIQPRRFYEHHLRVKRSDLFLTKALPQTSEKMGRIMRLSDTLGLDGTNLTLARASAGQNLI